MVFNKYVFDQTSKLHEFINSKDNNSNERKFSVLWCLEIMHSWKPLCRKPLMNDYLSELGLAAVLVGLHSGNRTCRPSHACCIFELSKTRMIMLKVEEWSRCVDCWLWTQTSTCIVHAAAHTKLMQVHLFMKPPSAWKNPSQKNQTQSASFT